MLDLWAYLHDVTLDFSRPGEPTDNAFTESFNGRVREECLNQGDFTSMENARERVESWGSNTMAAVRIAPWATWPRGIRC